MIDLGPDLGAEHGDHTTLRHALSLIEPDTTGWALEFGVGSGSTLRLIAERLPVLGFDGFVGLPEDWRPGFERGMFAQEKVPQVEGATVVVGLFEDTLPSFDWPDSVALCHLDADLYTSTATALQYAGHLIQPGTIVVLDEYHGYADDVTGEVPGEQRAWLEWTAAQGVEWYPIGHGREQLAVMVTERAS